MVFECPLLRLSLKKKLHDMRDFRRFLAHIDSLCLLIFQLVQSHTFFFIFCRRTNTMARITAKTLRTVGFTRLHSLRRIIWSFTENLRGLSWSPRFGFAEQASEFLDSKVPAVFQTLQPQDQVSCDCLRQPVYYWEVASSHESHRSLHW